MVAGSAGLLAVLYLAFSPRIFHSFYSRRLFHPWKYPVGDWDVEHLEGIAREDVYFKANDGSKLHGWFFQRPNSRYVVLFSHGNTGNLTGTNRLPLVNLLLKAGVSVFIYDYRGYGRSEGAPTVRGICEDGVAAFDYLARERGYVPDNIILYGESLGTAVASEIAAERHCAAIILQSGFTSLREIGQHHVPVTRIYPSFMYPPPLLDTVRRMSVDRRPLLIIHGQKDQVVPYSHAQEIFNNAAEPKMIVDLPECSHSDIGHLAPEVFVSSVKAFLASLA